MAQDPQRAPSASLIKLERPEKLQTVLEQDKQDDCLSCRLVGKASFGLSFFQQLTLLLGASAFIGLGGYSYFSGKYQLQQQEARILRSGSRFGMRSRHAGITSIALAFVGMGLWRLVN